MENSRGFEHARNVEGGVESRVEKEKKEYKSRVLLHFERHGDKDGSVLSEGGKKQLFEKGKARGSAEKTAVAIGSPLERAQHSAALDMAGAESTLEVTGDESLEELRKKLDAAHNQKVGSRIGTDKRLGFQVADSEYGKAVNDAFIEKKTGLEFLVNQSDALAREHGDTESLTYSGAASEVAQVVEKYVKVGENFDKIISDEEKRKEYGDTLERFLGSHAGVVDSFLAKVIERTKGTEARDTLVGLLNNGQGFSTSEGFDIEILHNIREDKPEVRVTYTKKNEDGKQVFELNEVIPEEILQEIIAEGIPQEESEK